MTLLTRAEFDVELRKLEESCPVVRILREAAIKYGNASALFENWPEQLKQEAYERIGVEPVVMYRRVR